MKTEEKLPDTTSPQIPVVTNSNATNLPKPTPIDFLKLRSIMGRGMETRGAFGNKRSGTKRWKKMQRQNERRKT